MRTQFSKVVMGLACLSMLASCASNVTAEEAVKITGKWNIDEASQAYTKGTATNEDSKGNKSTTNYQLDNPVGKAAVALLIVASAGAVNAAAAVEGTQFKADGNALEFTYKADEKETIEYKTNGYGLPTFTKTTYSDGSWSKSTYTWSK